MLTSAKRLSPVGDVKVDLVGDLGAFGSLCGLGAEERGEGHDDESYAETAEHNGMERKRVRGLWPPLTTIYVAVMACRVAWEGTRSAGPTRTSKTFKSSVIYHFAPFGAKMPLLISTVVVCMSLLAVSEIPAQVTHHLAFPCGQ